WYAMHFTGSTTFTSPTGVEKEMRRAIPVQAVALLLALIFWFTRAWTGGGA
ncbi:MAG: carbon monoxide dehydrogenase, partial [Deltaproteobacteria bacterium]